VLWNADDLGMTFRYRAAEVEAKRVGMQIVPLGIIPPARVGTGVDPRAAAAARASPNWPAATV
jgi:hypothetical protein